MQNIAEMPVSSLPEDVVINLTIDGDHRVIKISPKDALVEEIKKYITVSCMNAQA